MKSQISVEFLLLVAILIFIVSVTFLASGSFQTNVFEEKVYSSALERCRQISSEINIAVKIGDGYRRKFYLEEALYGNLDYSIEIRNYTVSIKWNEKSVSCSILTESVNGEVKKGWNLIQNVGGEIYVN